MDDYDDNDNIDISLANALRAARTNPDAVVLSLWPSAIVPPLSSSSTPSQIDVARSYLRNSHVNILHESSIEIPIESSTLLIMAAYWGEDWLRTNCWYGEQPLEELGMEHPTGSWPGAKWKKELCFRQDGLGSTTTTAAETGTMRMHVFVAVVGGGDGPGRRRRIWADKYSVRAAMARDTRNAGNSCMHLTDDQSSQIIQIHDRTNENLSGRHGGGGTDCNASYAFACARCLLNPLAMEFMTECATKLFPKDEDLVSVEFQNVFGNFCGWLGDCSFEDVVEVEGGDGPDGVVRKWNRPPMF